MDFDFQIYGLEETIGKYGKLLGKPMLYLRAVGWNNSSDVTKINASRDLYKDLVPLDMWTSMDTSEFNVVELQNFKEEGDDTGYTLNDMMTFLSDNFPSSQASVEAERYVFYALFNNQGQIIASNE